MNLRSKRDGGLVLPGYCRMKLEEQDDGQGWANDTSGVSLAPRMAWLYSEKALDIIRRYMAAFPELFRALNDNPDAYPFDLSTLVSSGSGENATSEFVARLRKFLDGLGLADRVWVPHASRLISRETVRQLESLTRSPPSGNV